MIDLHSHVLPRMDDGSSGITESLKLLAMLKEQGMSTVLATPHFYAQREDPDTFLRRRERVAAALMEEMLPGMPRLLLGAEVFYYPGISGTERLPRLQLGRSGLLLLEMPFHRWDSGMIGEVLAIHDRSGLKVVLAHVNRYFSSQNGAIWKELSDHGIRFQINAEALLDWRTRGRALRLLRDGRAQFIASDCHNLTTRPPRLGEALDVVRNKLGQQALDALEAEGEAWFGSRGVGS